jgi:glycosyltransferase involved in cell wall biosynthesis
MSAASAVLADGAARGRDPIDVLTITPFYPNSGDDSQGCFVAEPIPVSQQQFNVRNQVLAVRPFYRGKTKSSGTAFTAQWQRYFCLPGNYGLASSGTFLFAQIVRRVRLLAARGQLSMVHAHGPLPCGQVAMLIKRALGVPFVVTVHGLDAFSTEQVRGNSGRSVRRVCGAVYESAERVICVSTKIRDRVLAGAPGAKTSVIYNGVNIDMFQPSTSTPSWETVLSVGNLIPIKGHEVLLRAFARVHSIFPQATLQIIGDGPERERLELLAQQLDVHKQAHFLGRRTRRQVAEAMQECSIFALPSTYEGLGCVYLEAMSCGKPAIGCYGQGIEEVIRSASNGFLVRPNCIDELESVLTTLLRDAELRNKLGKAARETVTQNFTLTRQAENLAQLYRECMR